MHVGFTEHRLPVDVVEIRLLGGSPVPVVPAARFRIAQQSVCFGHLLEPLLGSRITRVTVRVVAQRLLAVSASYLVSSEERRVGRGCGGGEGTERWEGS